MRAKNWFATRMMMMVTATNEKAIVGIQGACTESQKKC